MARIEIIERRLLNWARWRHGSGAGGLGYSAVKLTGSPSRDGYREAVIPTVDCEAEETDRAVAALSVELRQAVEAFYMGSSGHEAKARRLGLTRAGLYQRIDQAHLRIQSWLADAEQARRRQRERVDAMQRAARP